MSRRDLPLFFSSSPRFLGMPLVLAKAIAGVFNLLSIPRPEPVDEDAPPRVGWRASPDFYKKSSIVIYILKAGWA